MGSSSDIESIPYFSNIIWTLRSSEPVTWRMASGGGGCCGVCRTCRNRIRCWKMCSTMPVWGEFVPRLSHRSAAMTGVSGLTAAIPVDVIIQTFQGCDNGGGLSRKVHGLVGIANWIFAGDARESHHSSLGRDTGLAPEDMIQKLAVTGTWTWSLDSPIQRNQVLRSF